jgi:hypothetical protein
MTMDREEEHAYYAKPENRQAQGPARRRKTQLSEIVPVRLSSSTLGRVKAAAESSDQSISSWIRRAIEKELVQSGAPESDAGDAGGGRPARFVSITPLLTNEPILVNPAEAVRAQVIITFQDLLDAIEHELRRVDEVSNRGPLSDAFVHHRRIDSDAMEHRIAQYGAAYATLVERDVRQTQDALSRLSRLQSFLRGTDIPKKISELRGRVAEVKRLANEVEGTVLHAPKDGFSDLADAGLINFYRYTDVARATLRQIDDELYELSQ